jgi:hypothetical protein
MQASQHDARVRVEDQLRKLMDGIEEMASDARNWAMSMVKSVAHWGHEAADEVSRELNRAEERAGRSTR